MKSIVVLFIMSFLRMAAQVPQVPTKIYFADMELKLNKGVRHKIQQEVDKLRKSEVYFQKYVDKADLHFPVIEKAFQEVGCPDDIKYLILQETGINATAVSSSNAVGYWQFKKATGQEVGLTIEGGIDERKNIYASSVGCATYMKRNNSKLDNWLYTVIAYNTGLSGSSSATKEKYFGAKRMDVTASLHWYAIKFLAHKIAYELEIGKKAHEKKLEVFKMKPGQSVRQVSKKRKLTLEDIKPYNEWVSSSKKMPQGKPYYVVLPVANNDQVLSTKGGVPSLSDLEIDDKIANMSDDDAADIEFVHDYAESLSRQLRVVIPQESRITTINARPAVIPTKGETVVTLARQAGITHKKFRVYNEMLLFEDVIPGVPYFSKRKKGRSIQEFHVVQKGESLWKIAQLYGVKKGSLRRKNRMRQTEALQEGRILYLANKRPSDVPIRIQKNEKVGKEKSLSLDRKETENQPIDLDVAVVDNEVDSSSNSPLRQVKILDTTSAPKEKMKRAIEVQAVENHAKTETIKPSLSTSNHLVMQGETLYSISKKYTVSVAQLKSWNVIESKGLEVGQVLVISDSTDLVETATQRIEELKNEPFDGFHIVKKGDTMYSISKKYNVSVSDLLLLNGKSNGALSIGDRIKIEK